MLYINLEIEAISRSKHVFNNVIILNNQQLSTILEDVHKLQEIFLDTLDPPPPQTTLGSFGEIFNPLPLQNHVRF